MKNLNSVKTFGKKSAVALTAMGTSIAANAADYTSQIGAAGTEANANQTAVITAVIALAVIGFGVGALLKWMK